MSDAMYVTIQELRAEALRAENAKLREALKQARQFALIQGYTSRELAQCIGITAAQLSAWTDSTPDREPDFKD